MDVVGWLTIGALALLVGGSSLWSAREDRRRCRALRAFAAANDLREISGRNPQSVPPELHQARGIPAFHSPTPPVRAIVPLRTRIRWGYAWAILVELSRADSLLALNLVGSDLWRLFGRSPRSWVRAALPATAFAKHFALYHPAGATPDRVLRPEHERALAEAHRDVVAWIVRPDGTGVLIVRENYGAAPEEWLPSALAIARALA
jgi:hypothetical protein